MHSHVWMHQEPLTRTYIHSTSTCACSTRADTSKNCTPWPNLLLVLILLSAQTQLGTEENYVQWGQRFVFFAMIKILLGIHWVRTLLSYMYWASHCLHISRTGNAFACNACQKRTQSQETEQTKVQRGQEHWLHFHWSSHVVVVCCVLSLEFKGDICYML
jgi:hypothetical protein